MSTLSSTDVAEPRRSRRPIGIFDSGVGGLTVVRAVRALLPGEDVVYIGDTARLPYGSKSPRTVERYALGCQQFLLDRGVKLVLIACNTASANALPALSAASPVPVIGAVEPGAASALAASVRRRIGVIGTLATVRSGAYERAIRAHDPSAVVYSAACPLLVPLAEEGWTDDDIARAVVRRYLAPLLGPTSGPAREIDTLVLGCTHYPLLRGVIAEVAAELAGAPVTVVDSATAMAHAASDALGSGGKPAVQRRVEPGRLDCFATDTSRLDEIAARFLGETPTGFELVDL